MDVDGKKSYPSYIDSLSTSYPQFVDNFLFRGKAWILYLVDGISSLLYVVFITLNLEKTLILLDL